MDKKTIINWCILFFLSIVWGSSFILMKKSLLDFSFLEVGIYRLSTAFFFLIPFTFSSLKKIRKRDILPLCIVSIIGTVIPAIIFAKSQMHIESSLAGMLNSLTPLFTILLGILLFNKKWNKYNLIGIIIGVSGTYFLLQPLNSQNSETPHILMVIFATFCYAFSINIIKEKLTSLKSIEIASVTSLISFIFPLIYIFTTGLKFNANKILLNWSSFYYLIILGGICTSLAIVVFNFLIKRSTALFASSTTYLIPVFAIIWGILDFEIITQKEIVGIFVILAGVLIMNYRIGD